MRNEKQIFTQILTFAEAEDRIRAVGLNGSRVNPTVKSDIFQDYDIALIVRDMETFIEDRRWLLPFGTPIITQTPEASTLFPTSGEGWFTFLVQFDDGVRIDFALWPLEKAEDYRRADKLTLILLDKDGLFPGAGDPTDEDYHVKPPTQAMFEDCRNEFWWVSTYIAKGLWRGERLYAADHMESCVRQELLRMLQWYAGAENSFAISAGKSFKYLDRYLPEAWERALRATYVLDTEGHCWEALFAACGLFAEVTAAVAEAMEFEWDGAAYDGTLRYLRHIAALPRDAKEIY
ncbi:aminoglycoside 6-adenylyltransferase [Oscillospiraceae bacterium OttesenSCG-928-F05]|nr:aminoglycoside 6-adenylyltransferase [Oscillospiraceae bacterium OttesenSCG-928-F05]